MFACSVLVVLAMGSADPEIVLSWDAPPDCPGEPEVRARVLARLGDRAAARIEAEAVVDRDPADVDVWHLHVWLRSEDTVAERSLTGRSCDALADATATILSVAAMTKSESTATASEIPVPTPIPEPTARVEQTSPVARTMAPSNRASETGAAPSREPTSIPRPRGRLMAAGGVDYNAVPRVGGTLAIELGLYWPRLRMHAIALHAIDRRVSAGDVAARHRLTTGGLGVCGVAPLRSFELGGCAGAELGVLHSQGIRGRSLAARRTLWGAVTAGGVAGWRFASRWSLVLRADAVVPLSRRQFLVGDTAVGRTGVVGLRALLGIAVVFP